MSCELDLQIRGTFAQIVQLWREFPTVFSVLSSSWYRVVVLLRTIDEPIICKTPVGCASAISMNPGSASGTCG